MARAAATKSTSPQAGKNYGWPVITYGREYSGAGDRRGHGKAGMEQPVLLGPVHRALRHGFPRRARLPGLEGAALRRRARSPAARAARRRRRTARSTDEERYAIGKRVRDVREGPDGALYLVTDEDAGEFCASSPAN